MARGRMLNRSISKSKQVAQLIEVAGFDAGFIFCLMIAHADREGRLHGDPDVLKGMLAPRVAGITPAKIRKIAAAAQEIGLIDWYEVDGDLFISLPGFERNQAGLRKDREPESLIKSPTSGKLPEECRQTADNDPPEGKGKEDQRKGKEGKGIGPAASAGVHSVWGAYMVHHPHAQLSQKIGKLIAARMTEGSTVETLKLSVEGCHRSAYHCGENKDNRRYQSAELIFRDAEHVTMFAEMVTNPPITPKGPTVTSINAHNAGLMSIEAMIKTEEAKNARQREGSVSSHVPGNGKLLPGPANPCDSRGGILATPEIIPVRGGAGGNGSGNER